MSDPCTDNRDSLKLTRDGTSQQQRGFPALDPAYAPVNEHTVAHAMGFARQYATFLRFFNDQNQPADSWQKFFSEDVSVLFAVAAVQNVDAYRQEVKRSFDFLNDLAHDLPAEETNCKKHLGYLFSSVASLAARLDEWKEALPADHRLRGVLENVIKTQLAPHFQRFWAYYKYDDNLGANRLIDPVPALTGPVANPAVLRIMGAPALPAATVSMRSFSTDWIPPGAASSDWPAFFSALGSENGYGLGGSPFTQINRLSTNNLFTAIFDQFLRAYARIVAEAKTALEDSFARYDNHAPHYTLFIAFLHLLDLARTEANTLTERHLDFYYKKVLRLREKPAGPGQVHVLVELAKHALPREFPAGEKFAAGKDALGHDVFFQNNRDFVANKAKVTALKTVYRYLYPGDAATDFPSANLGRLYASPVANSNDGRGAELTSPDHSWHPFFNKVYIDGMLSDIKMPPGEVGFAVTSHHLLLAGGARKVTINLEGAVSIDEAKSRIQCLFTTEEGWLEAAADSFTGKTLTISLNGSFPPVVPYSAKVHGYGLNTGLPVMLVRLRNDPADLFLYPALHDTVITRITLDLEVRGLKFLAVSNDFGPVDTSKPFQPFGAQPLTNNSLVIGSKEVFQKKLTFARLKLAWQNQPKPFTGAVPKIRISHLADGNWPSFPTSGGNDFGITENEMTVTTAAQGAAFDAPDLSENEQYHTAARHGFVRLNISDSFGQDQYQARLVSHLRKDKDDQGKEIPHPGPPPLGPFATAITIDYDSTQDITLDSDKEADFNRRQAKFFHIYPFGHAEQHPFLSGSQKIYLLPQFQFLQADKMQEAEAEFYIGVAGLVPPQNLSLLFQVADGTANPEAEKPPQHFHWSYLSNNRWLPFGLNEVNDGTGGLLRSGIVTLAIPRDATNANTLLPTELHWIRVAVATNSDVVCRLRLVAAQALLATFADAGNDPAFSIKPLPAGTITQLEQPDAAIKTILQPFESFGGRGREAASAFYTRVSERLRHKDRAVALWDYERLVLEAFPQIYRIKCLPHTQFQPAKPYQPATPTQEEKPAQPAKYRELAPGHVTLIVVPDHQQHNQRDPLKPFASLGLLQEIEVFLRARTSCFVTLHVRNPEFEEVNTEFQVSLLSGYDETYYKEKLKQEITRFLSPWAYADGSSPTFGGKIYRSVLINFVEERPYVDFVTEFVLRHTYFSEAENKDVTTENLSEIEPSKAVSILVSAPANRHLITVIPEGEKQNAHEKCPCQT